MSNTGGSHTAFNGPGFTAGAFGASLGIAGALVQGCVNAVAQKKERDRWANWDLQQRGAALDLSEALRRGEYTRRVAAEKREAALLAENARLRAAPRVATARAMLER